MLNLKLGEKELKIKFGYEATVRSGIIKKLVDVETDAGNIDTIQSILEFIPELILVGAQKFHKGEFGYDYETGEGKEEKTSMIYSLLDDYFESKDSDLMELLGSLKKELLTDGFLSNIYRQEQKSAKNGKSRGN